MVQETDDSAKLTRSFISFEESFEGKWSIGRDVFVMSLQFGQKLIEGFAKMLCWQIGEVNIVARNGAVKELVLQGVPSMLSN